MDYKKKTKQELIKIVEEQGKVLNQSLDLLQNTYGSMRRIVRDEIEMYSYFLHQMKIDNVLKIGFWVAGIGLGVIIGVMI